MACVCRTEPAARTALSKLESGERPQSFDKDFIRSWVTSRCNPYTDPIPEIPRDVIVEAARVYIEAFEKITGENFSLPRDPHIAILDRIRANLAGYF